MFEVYEDTAGGWRWRLKATNAEIVSSGEAYTRREDAMRGAHDAAAAVLSALLAAFAHPFDQHVGPLGDDVLRAVLSRLVERIDDVALFKKED